MSVSSFGPTNDAIVDKRGGPESFLPARRVFKYLDLPWPLRLLFREIQPFMSVANILKSRCVFRHKAMKIWQGTLHSETMRVQWRVRSLHDERTLTFVRVDYEGEAPSSVTGVTGFPVSLREHPPTLSEGAAPPRRMTPIEGRAPNVN